MTLRDFADAVRDHPRLSLVGLLPGGLEVAVRQADSPPGAARAVPLRDVARHGWAELEAVLDGRRPGRVLTRLARVVGYFSQQRNWNRSKLAEQADRRRGDYGVPARAELPREELPHEVLAAHVAAGADVSCDLGEREGG